jgi:aspartate-semialdehyde dehydrogenase
MARPLTIAVLGATGAVGRAIVQVLEEQDLPVAWLRLLARTDSAGEEIDFRGDSLEVEEATPAAFRGVDVAFFAVPAAAAREWAPRARAEGCRAVVDASAAFRGDPDVPLVVANVNPQALDGVGAGDRGLVAGPEAAALLLATALEPLRKAAGLERVTAVTLHAASGSGEAAVRELESEVADLMNGRVPDPSIESPHRVAFNLVPQVGSFEPGGRTDEEARTAAEVRRVLSEPALPISVASVRVPVFYGHTQLVWLRTRRRLAAEAARDLLRHAPGLKLLDAPAERVYPMPMLAVKDDAVLVGRVREDDSQENGLELVVCGDNLRAGAAANAVAVARLLAKKGL